MPGASSTSSLHCGTGGFSIRRRAPTRLGDWRQIFRAAGSFVSSGFPPTRRRIELLPDHRIRPCRRHEHYWHVADGRDGLELRIEGNGLRSCALRRSEDGTWHGRYLQSPGMPVELVPTDAGSPAEQRCDGADRAALLSLLDRILDSGASLPWDREVARDLAGSATHASRARSGGDRAPEDESARRCRDPPGRGGRRCARWA